MVANFDM